MKTKNKYLVGCFSLLLAFSSCTKMNDTQEKFLEWGEAIYAAKIDSAFALSGYQRQVIDIFYSAPRIDRGQIVYNLNKDTVDFTLPEDGSRHFSVTINDLEEAEYNYTIRTFDKDGNSSLPIEISGKVYGRFYGDYLVKKAIDRIDNKDVFSIYTKGATDAAGINVTYTTTEGIEVTKSFPASEGAAVIKDAEPGSEFSYTTYYYPDETAVDSIESLANTATFPDKYLAGIQKYDSPSNTKDEFGWTPEHLYDGITSEDQGWHTWFDNTWPHSMTFSINEPFIIENLRIFQRASGDRAYQTGNPKKFTILGTNETPNTEGTNDGWEIIGEFEIIKPDDATEAANAAAAGHPFTVANPKAYRYLRIQVTDTWSGEQFTHFTELQFFGMPE